MAFVVEDGTGLSNANSYVSVADALTYFSDRNITDWASLTTAQQQAALINATSYIDTNYLITVGYRIEETQALQFPLDGVVDCNDYLIPKNTIPNRLKEAVYILAKQIGVDGTDLNAPIDRATKSEAAGSVSVEYMDGATVRATQSQVTSLLNFLTCGNVTTPGATINNEIFRG